MASATLQTDENNDLFLPDGQNLVILTGSSACSQNIRHRTLLRKSENIYNVNDGVDYLGSIFSPQPDLDMARKSLIDNIMAVPDVLSVVSLDIIIDEEDFDYVAQIATPYGQLNIRSDA